MTRHTFQQGYCSDPIRTRNGIVFKIRYRTRTSDGKWKHHSETLYGLKGRKEAREVLRNRIKSGIQTPVVTDLSFHEFVDTFWKPHIDRKNLKPSTKSGYLSALSCHVYPDLGDISLAEITPLHVENLVRKKETEGLSAKSIRNILVILQSIFGVAVDNDLLLRSPIRKSHKPDYVRRKKTAWSAEQIRKILEDTPPEYTCLFTCIALTGLRIGELLALQWNHVDFENRVITIQQNLWRRTIVSPKTQSSFRTLPIGEVLAELLANHRRSSEHPQPNDFVFCNKYGTALNPDVLRKDILYPILDRLQIPRPKRSAGFHAFRHSAASLIHDRTGSLKLAQDLLGHANLDTTADTYTHPSTEAQREAYEVLEQAFFSDLFPIVPKTGNTNSKLVN